MSHLCLRILITFFSSTFISACSELRSEKGSVRHAGVGVQKQIFGKTLAGDEVWLYTLTNSRGMSASVIDYGATVVSLKVPDKYGQFSDVVIGYNNIEDYQKRSQNFGATIGRVAGRINQGRFLLDGQVFELPKNLENQHTVHGGPLGFDKVMWTFAKSNSNRANPSVTLRYLSSDGDMGFPGNLSVYVTYTLTAENGLRIDYTASTDKPTPINLTHHGYFNLKGEGNGDVLDHRLQIDASQTTSTHNLVPKGKVETLLGTILDFTQPKLIGEHIHDAELATRRGYNNYYVFDNWSEKLKRVAKLQEDRSGRTMEVWTTELGMQFYTGNFLNSQLIGKSGKPYVQYGGLCLETQHYPDSPNQPHFPNSILRPGREFRSTTIYKFGLQL